jgi:hypothetical protein
MEEKRVEQGKTKVEYIKENLLVAKDMLATGFSGGKVFFEVKSMAKLAGKLLACSLVLRFPFETQAVSLIGFSFGTQVIKSCLKTLNFFGATTESGNCIVSDAVLMGGAVNFSGLGKEQKWRLIFGQTIPGSLCNIFSEKDYILIGYQIAHLGKKAGGRTKLPFEEQEEQKKALHEISVLPNFKNFDITNIAYASDGSMESFDTGHLDYRSEIMFGMLELIKFQR